jgi:hypothetical protein
MHWKQALERARQRDEMRPGLREFTTVSIYNKQFYEKRKAKTGCIRLKLRQGTYIVVNPHTQVDDVPEDQVEEVLGQLNIANSDWR